MIASSKRIVVMGVVDEAPVEIERYPPLRDIEGEFTEGTVVVFPAVILLFKVPVAKLRDGFAKGDFVGGEFVASRLGVIERDLRCREFHGLGTAIRGGIVDLSLIAFTVKAYSDVCDACGRQCIEHDALVEAVRFSARRAMPLPSQFKILWCHDLPLWFE
jgi:hypothetical protein